MSNFRNVEKREIFKSILLQQTISKNVFLKKFFTQYNKYVFVKLFHWSRKFYIKNLHVFKLVEKKKTFFNPSKRNIKTWRFHLPPEKKTKKRKCSVKNGKLGRYELRCISNYGWKWLKVHFELFYGIFFLNKNLVWKTLCNVYIMFINNEQGNTKSAESFSFYARFVPQFSEYFEFIS